MEGRQAAHTLPTGSLLRETTGFGHKVNLKLAEAGDVPMFEQSTVKMCLSSARVF